MKSDLAQQILNLQDGDHLCLFYEKDPAEQMPALVPFIQQGLVADQQFIYIADDQSVEDLSERLTNSGVNVRQEINRRALKLWTREQWRQPGELSAEKKIGQVQRFVEDAIDEGFKGIRFAVEMTWTLGPELAAPELERWEAKLNEMFVSGFPGRIVCQYNRSRLAPDTLLAALQTHPLAILDEEVFPNFFYQAPLLLSANGNGHNHGELNAAKVEWMLGQLKRARASERQREELTRKHASFEEAERGRKRIEIVLESITDGFITLDLNGQCTFVNSPLTAYWGRKREELLGKNIWQEFPELAGSKFHAECNRARATGQAITFEEFFSQRCVWLEGRIYPSCEGLTIYFRDVTERRCAAEANEWLAAIVESSNDAVIGKDLNGIVTSWNKGAERLFGYNAEEMIGRSITTLIPDERKNEESGILERLRRGERMEHFETVRRRKDGSLVEISLTISPVKDRDGRIIGASKIARDITERKRAEQTVRDMQEQLSRAYQELEKRVNERTVSLREAVSQMEEFSYSISHDLRAPVRAMHGYAKAVVEDYGNRLDDHARDFLERIVRGSLRLDRLIQDILIYSRLARCEIRLQPVSLDRLTREILQQYPEMQPPSAEISITGELLSVQAHEPSLTQAISNLLGNAVKFVPPGKTPNVRLWTERRGEQIRLWVEDNGIGIKPEHQRRLFGMFERVHPDKRYEGTGIGLAIVRKAIERMGGKVGVISDGIVGSSFWLELTAAQIIAVEPSSDRSFLTYESAEHSLS